LRKAAFSRNRYTRILALGFLHSNLFFSAICSPSNFTISVV
jgi:hypothetical protein